jgi:hypothetical protein
VRRWHDRPLRIIGTKPFDDTWADFAAAYPRVRFPKGQEPMSLIVQRTDASPPPSVAERYDAPETRRLVALCRELQRASGENPFFPSCRTAAGLVALEQATAWRRLGTLVADRVLIVVQVGTQHRAIHYRPRFPIYRALGHDSTQTAHSTTSRDGWFAVKSRRLAGCRRSEDSFGDILAQP